MLLYKYVKMVEAHSKEPELQISHGENKKDNENQNKCSDTDEIMAAERAKTDEIELEQPGMTLEDSLVRFFTEGGVDPDQDLLQL